MNTDTKYISDDNKRYLTSASRNLKKFITPLLKVEEGEKMTVDVGRQTSYAADDILLNVYYSTDREEWTLLTTVPSSDLPNTVNSGYNRQYLPKTVVLEGIPAGEVYVAFEAGYLYIDNIYGFVPVDVDHDVIISSCSVPATAMANNDLTVKATLKNILGIAEAADYTANLYFDGEVVATADAKEIPAVGTADFEFTFVPTEVGEHTAYVEFVWNDGYTVTSEEATVTITAESAEKTVVVGNTDPSNDAWQISTQSFAVPICNYYRNSWCEAFYTPTMLIEAGLTEGEAISSITYMGYCPGEVTDAIKVYVITTSDDTMEPFSKTDVSALTPVYDGEYTFVPAGTAEAPVDLFRIDLAEPIVWDGNSSLRIVVASDRVSGSDTRSCFLTDTNINGQCYQNRSDTQSSSAMAVTSKCSYFPVTKFGVQLTPNTYSGKVTDTDGNPLAGVTVTLTSRTEVQPEGAPRRAATTGPVAYTATTDENGDFSVEVVQTDKVYDANFTLEGYKPVTVENIDFANGNVTLTEPVVMELDEITAISDLSNAAQVVSVTYVNAAGVASTRPFDGMNIVITRRADGSVTTTKVVK